MSLLKFEWHVLKIIPSRAIYKLCRSEALVLLSENI